LNHRLDWTARLKAVFAVEGMVSALRRTDERDCSAGADLIVRSDRLDLRVRALVDGRERGGLCLGRGRVRCVKPAVLGKHHGQVRFLAPGGAELHLI
jgi:hypothetical protein